MCEVSIIQTYTHLSYGRWNWWWRTFVYGASTSVWLGLLLAYHLCVNLKVQHLTTLMVYFITSSIVCVTGGLAAGSAALLASFAFNSHIFRKVRED